MVDGICDGGRRLDVEESILDRQFGDFANHDLASYVLTTLHDR